MNEHNVWRLRAWRALGRACMTLECHRHANRGDQGQARSQTREPRRIEAPSQRHQDCGGHESSKKSDNVAAIIAPQKLKRVSVQIEEEIVRMQTHMHRGLFLERDEKHDRDE